MTTQITRDDVMKIIENYHAQGRDTTELDIFLREAFPSSSRKETPSVDQMVAELRRKSPVTEGRCCVCGDTGILTSGVCERCFLPWATKVSEDSIARVMKHQRGK